MSYFDKIIDQSNVNVLLETNYSLLAGGLKGPQALCRS